MGGFFGAVLKEDAISDVFFGTDYHSHLGTRRAGIAAYDPELGMQRKIHSIQNSPFRTKFEHVYNETKGTAAIGCISDYDPQPLLVRSRHGTCAICFVGAINNAEELISKYLTANSGQFLSMNGGGINNTEIVAMLINQKESFVDGIKFAQDIIDGSASIIILTEKGKIIAARDKLGRLPVLIGKREDGFCVSFESFAYQKLGYENEYELGPGEIVKITPEGYETLKPAGEEMKICAFLWSYYGYPNSNYEGVNVEVMRYKNGEIMARDEALNGTLPDVDYVAGIPDSGVPHAMGYANQSGQTYARPFVKYTPTWPRSFTPANQKIRNRVAKMKQIPVPELIEGKKLLFVDDSLVRGTQLRETVDFLYHSNAKEVHMRSACPPIMYGCKFLNFTSKGSEDDLLARRIIHELEGLQGDKYLDEYIDASTERGQCMLKRICEKLGFSSLGYQSLEGLLEAIGLPREKVCTYCWNGKE